MSDETMDAMSRRFGVRRTTPGKKLALVDPSILKKLMDNAMSVVRGKTLASYEDTDQLYHSGYKQSDDPLHREQFWRGHGNVRESEEGEEPMNPDTHLSPINRRKLFLRRRMANQLTNTRGQRETPELRRARFNNALTEYGTHARRGNTQKSTLDPRHATPVDEVVGSALWGESEDEEDEEDEDEDEEEEDEEERLMKKLDKAVPKTARPRAKALLKLIASSGGRLGWNPTGSELTVRGRAIPGSNILDLVVYVARDRRSSRGRASSKPPPGFREFATGLRGMNAPRELVRNRRRWPDIYGEEDVKRVYKSYDKKLRSSSEPSELKREPWLTLA